MTESLEQKAARERLVYVPVSVEIDRQLRAEDGPLYVRIEDDPGGHPLLRTLVLRRPEPVEATELLWNTERSSA